MSDDLLSRLELARRSYIRTFGRMPESITISESIDQQLCDTLEKHMQWTQWLPGSKLKTMHGGKLFNLTVSVVPAIDFQLGWEKPDA